MDSNGLMANVSLSWGSGGAVLRSWPGVAPSSLGRRDSSSVDPVHGVSRFNQRGLYRRQGAHSIAPRHFACNAGLVQYPSHRPRGRVTLTTHWDLFCSCLSLIVTQKFIDGRCQVPYMRLHQNLIVGTRQFTRRYQSREQPGPATRAVSPCTMATGAHHQDGTG